MKNFKSVTILLPVIDEFQSLQKTFETIISTCRKEDLEEIVFLVSKITKDQSLSLCQDLISSSPVPCLIHQQTLPFLGGAIREGFQMARGSHVVMMASDLETDPSEVQNFISLAKSHPESVITGTRWVEKAGFKKYNKVKLVLNYIFQNFFSLIYRTRLTDLTYGYRLFPSHLLKKIKWEETRHPFLFETICKPLRLGIDVIEIPVTWRARVEGLSRNSFFRNFEYFKIGLKTRFQSPEKWKV